jgi:transposase-like protein
MDKQQRQKFSPEVRARAVRMVIAHRGDHASQWAAIVSIAAKIGCTAQTLHNWVAQAERDQGRRSGSTTDERERTKALERENRELRQANEILRKASAYCSVPGTVPSTALFAVECQSFLDNVIAGSGMPEHPMIRRPHYGQ